MKILVLGDGLLGKEIVKQNKWDYISAKKDGIDANHFDSLIEHLSSYDTIVNCIGYTNTYDKEKEKHWKINYEFVVNLVDFCSLNNKKLIHISTDYVYANTNGNKGENDIPVHQQTWYSYTKLLSDGYVQLKLENYLLFRCSFKPKPFPYDKAFINVMGNFDYVDVIVQQIIDLIQEQRIGVWNIGTPYKTVYDLAVQTNTNVGVSKSDVLPSIHMDLIKFHTRK